MKETEIDNIAIVLKPSEFEDLNNLITNLVRWLKRRDKNIFFIIDEKQRLKDAVSEKTFDHITFQEPESFFNSNDLLISLGGDGTLLGVCRRIGSETPIFGVNLGRLGFITEFNKNEFYEELNLILLGKFEVFSKPLYKCNITSNDGATQEKNFFNDLVFTKNEIARMFTLSVETNNQHIYNVTGDGLIVSSTYGSTAYSLAAGGPIVHPDVNALILTPICAHSLTHRPMVIPDDYSLQIGVLDKIDTVNLTLDGQIAIHIKSTDLIEVTKDVSQTVSLIKNTERTYFHTLKEKFVHGRRCSYKRRFRVGGGERRNVIARGRRNGIFCIGSRTCSTKVTRYNNRLKQRCTNVYECLILKFAGVK
jgi:NAD+ kinase